MHRPESVLEKDDFTLTFIEFDDQGEPWAPAQLERTIQVIVIASAEVLDGKKRDMETHVVVFDFGSVGSESLEWTEIRSDMLFSAATAPSTPST